VAALHPTKNPGNGTKVFPAVREAAAGGTGAIFARSNSDAGVASSK